MHVAYFPARGVVFLVSGPGHVRQGPGGMLHAKMLEWPCACWAAASTKASSPPESTCVFLFFLNDLHRLISRSLYEIFLVVVVGGFFPACGGGGLRHLHKNLPGRLTTLTRYTSKGKGSASLGREHGIQFLHPLCVSVHMLSGVCPVFSSA